LRSREQGASRLEAVRDWDRAEAVVVIAVPIAPCPMVAHSNPLRKGKISTESSFGSPCPRREWVVVEVYNHGVHEGRETPIGARP